MKSREIVIRAGALAGSAILMFHGLTDLGPRVGKAYDATLALELCLDKSSSATACEPEQTESDLQILLYWNDLMSIGLPPAIGFGLSLRKIKKQR